MPAGLYCTCAVLSLHQELAFCSTFNGRPRWAEAGLGSMAISCAVCSVQRAVCSVCVHDRHHRCLHDYALTSCNRLALTSLASLQEGPRLPLTPRQAEDLLRQFLFLSMCCMPRCSL